VSPNLVEFLRGDFISKDFTVFEFLLYFLSYMYIYIYKAFILVYLSLFVISFTI